MSKEVLSQCVSRMRHFKASKATLSNTLLLCFFLAIIFSAAFSEFFQTPNGPNRDLLPYRRLFHPNQLDNVQKLELINGLGTFHLEKRQKLGAEVWELTYPRSLPANKETIAKILSGLKAIKILKIYTKDPINISNYSLNNPLMKINLTDISGEKTSLALGLVNPIRQFHPPYLVQSRCPFSCRKA